MKINPLHDLIAILDLPEETLKLMGANRIQGLNLPSPGWFVGEVVAVSSRIAKETDLKQGDRCLIQDMSSPEGAGWLPSEEFGLEPGGRVILVPCRTIQSPERSEELVERRREMLQFERRYPVEKFPLPAWHTGREEDAEGHEFWNTDVGKGLLNQLRENIVQIQQIMRARKGKGRNKLLKPVDEANWCRSAAEGVLAVIEDDELDGKPMVINQLPDEFVMLEGEGELILGRGAPNLEVILGAGRNEGPTRNRPYPKEGK